MVGEAVVPSRIGKMLALGKKIHRVATLVSKLGGRVSLFYSLLMDIIKEITRPAGPTGRLSFNLLALQVCMYKPSYP